jgi:hypothetical protein
VETVVEEAKAHPGLWRQVEGRKEGRRDITITSIEKFYLLGYDTVESLESHPTFWRTMSSPSSVSKNNPRKKQI